jgi:hypothetical protein
MRFVLAIRAFFRILFSASVGERVRRVLEGGPAEPAPRQPAAPAPPPSGEALALLAALQREARLVDFLQESLEGYSDAQIGAAVRDVHRDCGKVLARMFDLRPVLTDPEGAEVEVPEGFDAHCYRLTGNVAGQPPYRGAMVHHGWKAARCDVPARAGGAAAARIVAPAEVELK